jgi:hypothetical protein
VLVGRRELVGAELVEELGHPPDELLLRPPAELLLGQALVGLGRVLGELVGQHGVLGQDVDPGDVVLVGDVQEAAVHGHRGAAAASLDEHRPDGQGGQQRRVAGKHPEVAVVVRHWFEIDLADSLLRRRIEDVEARLVLRHVDRADVSHARPVRGHCLGCHFKARDEFRQRSLVEPRRVDLYEKIGHRDEATTARRTKKFRKPLQFGRREAFRDTASELGPGVDAELCVDPRQVRLDRLRQRAEVADRADGVELVGHRAQEAALPRHPRVVARVLARAHVGERLAAVEAVLPAGNHVDLRLRLAPRGPRDLVDEAFLRRIQYKIEVPLVTFLGARPVSQLGAYLEQADGATGVFVARPCWR